METRSPTRDQIVARIRDRSADVRALGATALYIFGSRARQAARQESDLDVFVDFDPTKFGFVELIELETLLAQDLGIPVDLATRDALHPRLRESIESGAIRVI